ncbi:MAG: tetratricopeptide repeat protein [Gammaproteobacteria bacterium]|nr:MAG: tetratricopeptide repeat protein [Gammaproteobacteria bacterium]
MWVSRLALRLRGTAVVRHNALTDPGAEIPGTMLGPDVETNVLRHGSVSIDLLRAMLWVSLCLSSVVQAAIDDRRWCETQTARFTLVSDLKPERLQPIADDLLRFHAVAELLVPQDTSKQLPPLTIFAFKSARLLRSTFNVQSVSGLSLASHDGFTLVYGPRYGKRSLSSMTAFHEYSHYLMLSRPVLKYPLWYGEGLASLLSTMEFPDLNTARVGIVPPVRLRNATRDYNLPLDQVVNRRHAMEPGGVDFLRVYERSWILIHYLMYGHQAGFPNYATKIDRILASIDTGAKGSEAIERALGVSLEALEQDLIAYTLHRPTPTTVIEFTISDAQTSSRCLSKNEARILLANSTANRNPDLARKLLGKALLADPSNADVLVGLSRVDAINAAAYSARAMALAPENPSVLIRKAELSMQSCQAEQPLTCQAIWRTAAGYYRAALQRAPGRADATLALGSLYLLMGDADLALPLLEKALTLAPWQTQIHLYLGQAAAATGDVPRARLHLDRAANWHPELSGRQRARSVLNRLPI